MRRGPVSRPRIPIHLVAVKDSWRRFVKLGLLLSGLLLFLRFRLALISLAIAHLAPA